MHSNVLVSVVLMTAILISWSKKLYKSTSIEEKRKSFRLHHHAFRYYLSQFISISWFWPIVTLKSKLPPLVSFLVRWDSSSWETRLSSLEMRFSSCENHWSVYFGLNHKQLACEKMINLHHKRIWFFRLLLHTTLQEKRTSTCKRKGLQKRWKIKITDICENSRLAVTWFFSLQCIDFDLMYKCFRQLLYGNLLRKTQHFRR